MFNRLVGRAVFTQANRVVCENVNDALLHQRSHANSVARVIAESQERAAVWNKSAMQGDAVHDRCHAKFAHAVVDVTAGGVIGCAVAFCARIGNYITR